MVPVAPNVAAPEPLEIEPLALSQLLERDEVVLIDVREREEHDEERIPGATLVPLGDFDPCLISAVAGTRPVVVHCLAGSRSAKAAAALLHAGHVATASLRDGILGWKSAGLATVS